LPAEAPSGFSRRVIKESLKLHWSLQKINPDNKKKAHHNPSCVRKMVHVCLQRAALRFSLSASSQSCTALEVCYGSIASKRHSIQRVCLCQQCFGNPLYHTSHMRKRWRLPLEISCVSTNYKWGHSMTGKHCTSHR